MGRHDNGAEAAERPGVGPLDLLAGALPMPGEAVAPGWALPGRGSTPPEVVVKENLEEE
jgi:hypothetical protein